MPELIRQDGRGKSWSGTSPPSLRARNVAAERIQLASEQVHGRVTGASGLAPGNFLRVDLGGLRYCLWCRPMDNANDIRSLLVLDTLALDTEEGRVDGVAFGTDEVGVPVGPVEGLPDFEADHALGNKTIAIGDIGRGHGSPFVYRALREFSFHGLSF